MTDTKQEINCPACGKIMKKVFIDDKNFYVDVCADGCGGIFFDNREFKNFDEKNENADAIFESLKNNNFTSVDATQQRICPVCGAKMVKNFSSIKKEIEVDDCYTCGGKFLDRDELLKIKNEYENDSERTQAVVDFLYSKCGKELEENEQEGLKAKMDVTNADRLAAIIRKFI